MIDFYTVVLRKSADYWVALCLENGLVGQGKYQEEAINKLKEAIQSWQEIANNKDVYKSPISVQELHEFLTIETQKPVDEVFELRAVYA